MRISSPTDKSQVRRSRQKSRESIYSFCHLLFFFSVIPAQAGIYPFLIQMDPRIREDDKKGSVIPAKAGIQTLLAWYDTLAGACTGGATPVIFGIPAGVHPRAKYKQMDSRFRGNDRVVMS